MVELPANIPDIIHGFEAWYVSDPHKGKEEAYAGVLSAARIASLNDTDLARFFHQFAADGGKVQSGGHRTAPLLQKTIEQDPQAFRKHVLQPFAAGFDVASWLADIEQFKGWGKGIATIYLNRVDPKRFVVVNNKSVEAYEALGYPIRRSSLDATYADLQKAQEDILSRFPALDNFYRTDALSHFLLGTETGKELIGMDEVVPEDSEDPAAGDRPWLDFPWLRKVTEADWQFFLDECASVIEELELDAADERLVLNLRNDDRKRMSLNLLTRVYLAINHTRATIISIQLPSDAPERYPHLGLVLLKAFKNEPKSAVYELPIAVYRAERNTLLPEMVGIAKDHMARSGARSRQRMHHIPDLFPFVSDPAFRAQGLAYLLKGEGQWPALTNAHIPREGSGAGKSSHRMSLQYPLNTILYGPPGTGKTYHAISHAVAIIDGEDVEVVKQRPREQVRARYQQLVEARLVRTVTFHQSFSYEDFVEGIKPQTHVSKEGDEEVKLVTYEVQDGIFKLMCASARSGEHGSAAPGLDEDTLSKANFYKVSLGQYNSPADDAIYAYCMEHGVMAVGYGGAVDVSKAKNEAGIRHILEGAGMKESDSLRYSITVLRTMHLDMQVGDIVFVSAGNSLVRAIGRVSGGYFMDESAPIRFKQFRKVDWLVKDLEIPVEDLYPKSFVMGTLYSLDPKLVKKDYFRKTLATPVKRDGRYVLIIDEINRGNVASIFGELITLIEDDKREGGAEPAKVKLPYSKKDDFSVPSNLYLLGTMNTADRSVEALDTALRRRFSFVEMPSLPEVIEPGTVAGVDLSALLTRINQRVERLLDKDHHIGHSYFMGLNDLNDLKRVFKTKVIPLLEEYFHGDVRKVGAVIGKDFVQEVKINVPFAKEFELDEYEVKTIYRLGDMDAIPDAQPFIRIYANA